MPNQQITNIDELPETIQFYTPISPNPITLKKAEIEKILSCKLLVANPFWKYSKYLSKGEILRFLILLTSQEKLPSAESKNKKLLQKIANYLLLYAENMTLSGYIWAKASNEDPEEYLKYMEPILKKVREVARKPTLESIREAIDSLSTVGLDPL